MHGCAPSFALRTLTSPIVVNVTKIDLSQLHQQHQQQHFGHCQCQCRRHCRHKPQLCIQRATIFWQIWQQNPPLPLPKLRPTGVLSCGLPILPARFNALFAQALA
jgi:hypothetical protein